MRKTAKRKAAKKVAAKRRPGRRRGVRVSDSQRAALRRLVLARDKQVVAMLSGSNALAAYELGAELDGYIDELMTAARGR